MVNEHGKSWQTVRHSPCAFSDALNPHYEKKKKDNSQYILFKKSYCFDLKRRPSSKGCHHLGYLAISRLLSDCCPTLWLLTHPSGKAGTFCMHSECNEYLFSLHPFHSAQLAPGNSSPCSFQSVTPTASAVQLEKGHSIIQPRYTM